MKYPKFFKTLYAVRRELFRNCRHFATEAGMSVNTVRDIERGNQPPCSAC